MLILDISEALNRFLPLGHNFNNVIPLLASAFVVSEHLGYSGVFGLLGGVRFWVGLVVKRLQAKVTDMADDVLTVVDLPRQQRERFFTRFFTGFSHNGSSTLGF